MNGEQLYQAILADDLATLQQELPLDPMLIEYEAEEGVPLYFLAARHGSMAVLRYLMDYAIRVSLYSEDAQGRDMLHHAAMSGDAEKCRYLVERGGLNPLHGDLHLETPFDIAHRMGHAELESYFAAVVGAPWEMTYHNPIRTGFFPDPSIVRVGEDYYMVNSTFVFFPCIPVSHSRDLVNWQVIGHAIEKPEWAHLEGLEGGRGWWAPDISYANGRFYITATLRLNNEGVVCRRQMVVTAERPEGPYSEPVFFEEDGIDPSLFHDDDGRHYMLLNRGARIFEIDEAATRRLSETTLLSCGVFKRTAEGPHLLKKDGWYYLFLAEGGTGVGHRETVSRSRTLHGVYTPSPYNPVIRQWDERALIQRCGHAKPVSTPDGRWYFVYLCGRLLEGKWTMLGRETALDPFRWSPDGWPVMNEGRGPSEQNVRPLPPCPMAERTDWLTPRPPETAQQIVWQGSSVTICGSQHPMTDVRCRSILLRRQTSFRFRFGATLTVPMHGEAGVTGYYDEHSFFTAGIRLTEDGWHLCVQEQIGLEGRTALEQPVTLQSGETVRISVHTDGLTRRLCWTLSDGSEVHHRLDSVTYLSDEGVRLGKRFTGAMVGMYALGGNRAVFDQISCRDE